MIEDLTPTEEQLAFAEAAAKSFAACAGLSPEEISRRLAADGFTAMLTAEEFGGLGQGLRAALPVARAAGRHLLAFPLVEAMLATAITAHHDPGLLSGQGFATVAWGGDVNVRGGLAHGVAARAPACAAARWLVCGAGEDAAALIDLGAPGVEIVSSGELDIDRPYDDVILRDVEAVIIAEGWRALADGGAILRAADMIGAAEASLADACAHVSTRRQFGKPLSAHQAVSGALARDHYALTGAWLSVEYAALAADEGQDDAAIARDVACSVAHDACIAAAENAIQVHGAIGFTWAMPLHRRLRRIQSAGAIYSAKTARETLAATLLDAWKDAA
jgi:alkylation response protein AidB-like acyl-CoA dehydrogenase